MRIDFHSHSLAPGLPYLELEFKRAGMDHGVVMILPSALRTDDQGEYQLPISAETLEGMKEENLALARACENCWKAIPFAWLDYRMDDAPGFFESLVRDHAVRGLKIHQVFNGAADSNYYPLVERAVDLKVPVMIHTGFRPPARVEYVGALADKYPDGTFVCAHMVEEYGLNPRFSHIRMAKSRDNVYLECSYVPSLRRLKDAVLELGDDRVLFGSDYPLWHGDIAYSASVVERASIPEESKTKILGGNAKRILRL